MALTDKLSAIGNAIRSKTGKEDLMTLEDMPAEIENISGGTSLPTQEKSITITENGTVEVLPDEGYALGKVTANVQVYDGGADPRVNQIVNRTITEFNDNTITALGMYSFYGCSKLTSVNVPKVTRADSSVFRECSSLTSIDLPAITALRSYFFYGCSKLTSVNIPNVVLLEPSVFQNCSSLTSIDLPNVTSASGDSQFQGCRKLTSVNVPIFSKVPEHAFRDCSSLTSIDLPAAISLGMYSFYGCSALKMIILRSTETICSIVSKSALSTTPFASDGTGGICLVPSALITEYQNATNWSTLYAAGTCLFWALEDYTVDGTIEGEIDWDKLNTDREGAFA